MAWASKRKRIDGTKRYRIRDRIDGRSVVIVKDAGIWKEVAETMAEEFAKARLLGFKFNPLSPDVMADVREFLQAKSEGRDPKPTKSIADAVHSWIIDVRREPETIDLLNTTMASFLGYTKLKLLSEITKDHIDGWRSAMENGLLTYTRGGKAPDGQPIRHRYSPVTIAIHLRNLRSFLQYCADREWLSLKLVKTIKVSKVPSTRRFLMRPEVSRLMKACRVETFEQPGGRVKFTAGFEKRVIAFCLEHPTYGKLKVSKMLTAAGLKISSTGVESIERRHGIQTARDREQWRDRKKFPPLIDRPVAIRPNKKANNRLRKIILFGLYTGMRAGEVLRARRKDVTPQEILQRTKDGRIVSRIIYSVFIPKAKKHKQRTVALHPIIARIMGAAKYSGEALLLFPGWTEGKLGLARRRAVARAGLGRVRFHDLRHSFVRNYLKSRAGTLGEVREQTGHENLASLDPYAHFASADVAATIANMKIQ